MSNNPMPTQQIYFIDSAVPDSDILLAGLATDAVCYRIDATQDGLQQIADILAGYSGLAAIHVISHGSPGCLQLGNGLVTEDSLDGHRAALATIGGALAETGDLLLYGCDVAQGDKGQGFIAGLAEATGADVAGSDDLTGVGGIGFGGTNWNGRNRCGVQTLSGKPTAAHYPHNLIRLILRLMVLICGADSSIEPVLMFGKKYRMRR
jgi:hypothetical protein